MTKPETIQDAVLRVMEMDGFEQAVGRSMNMNSFSATYHHGIGTWIRNEFELWNDKSNLYQEFNERYALTHADDMSTIILHKAWCSLKEVEYDVEEDLKMFREHWDSFGK